MSIWSDHFENRDPALRPWNGDEWTNGLRTLKVVSALFDNGKPTLVVFDDATMGRVLVAGSVWKRETRSFKCTRRVEDDFAPEVIAELRY